jgi:hypothetical protein
MRGPSVLGFGRLIRYGLLALVMATLLGWWAARTYSDELAAWVAPWLQERVRVSWVHGGIDLERLSGREVRVRLTLAVDNRLPIGITLEDLTYQVLINQRVVATGLQANPGVPLPAGVVSQFDLIFAVDSFQARRAVAQAAVEKAPQLLMSVLDRLQRRRAGVPPPTDHPLAGLLAIKGQARFRLLFGSFALPVEQSGSFARSL